MNKKNNRKIKKFILTGLLILLLGLTIGVIIHVFPLRNPKSSEEANRIVTLCKNKSLTGNCYIKQFERLTSDKKIVFVKDVLRETKILDKKTLSCHAIAHAVANSFVKKNPQNWLEIFKQFGVEECSAGFLHGMIEAKVGNDPAFKLSSAVNANICDQIVNISQNNPDRAFVLKNCIHGIGHALLLQEAGDVKYAVKICEESFSQKDVNDCYLGVFMESIQRYSLNLHGISSYLPATPTELESQKNFCNTFRDEPSTACWLSLAWLINKTYNYDENKLFEDCEQAPLDKAKFSCYSWGINTATVASLSQNTSKKNISNFCNKYEGKEKWYSQCIRDQIFYVLKQEKKYLNEIILMCKSGNSHFNDLCQENLKYLLKENKISIEGVSNETGVLFD